MPSAVVPEQPMVSCAAPPGYDCDHDAPQECRPACKGDVCEVPCDECGGTGGEGWSFPDGTFYALRCPPCSGMGTVLRTLTADPMEVRRCTDPTALDRWSHGGVLPPGDLDGWLIEWDAGGNDDE